MVRSVAIVAAVAFVVGGIFSAARATYDETKSGVSYCSPEFTKLKSRSQGLVTHEWPASTPRVAWLDPEYRTHRSHTGSQNTSWRVGVEFNYPGDDLLQASTYAYSVPYG